MNKSFYKVEDVEKISSTIMWLGGRMKLTHTIKLGSTALEGKVREGYHREFRYESGQYSNKRYLNNIKLNFNSYLTIEHPDVDKMKQPYIHQGNLYRFIRRLDMVIEWFYKEFSFVRDEKTYKTELFLEDKDGKLILNSSLASVMFVLVELGSCTLMFKPTVIERDEGLFEGVTISFNNETHTSIDIEELESLRHFLSTINLYQLGISTLNYLGCPEEELNDRYVTVYSRGEEYLKDRTKFGDKVEVKSPGRMLGGSRDDDSKLI